MNKSNIKLVPPCSYQGGKQRLAKKIVDIIFEQNEINEKTKFYDLCCGSGAITLELINRGIHPINITMVDKSPWGEFWEKIGKGTFSSEVFKFYIDAIPKDITLIKKYAEEMTKQPANDGFMDNMIYKFLILQSCAFGSYQALFLRTGRTYFRQHELLQSRSCVRRQKPSHAFPSVHLLREK